jgi:kinesin family protein 22
VARRLQERERELEAERERERAEREREREREREKEREKEKEAGSSRHTKSPKRTRERELPPGLTPLLKRHKDLDDELQSRLAELERKVSVSGPRSRSRSFLAPMSPAMLTGVV